MKIYAEMSAASGIEYDAVYSDRKAAIETRSRERHRCDNLTYEAGN